MTLANYNSIKTKHIFEINVLNLSVPDFKLLIRGISEKPFRLLLLKRKILSLNSHRNVCINLTQINSEEYKKRTTGVLFFFIWRA